MKRDSGKGAGPEGGLEVPWCGAYTPGDLPLAAS